MIKIFFIGIIICFAFSNETFATWDIPEGIVKKKNPLEIVPKNVAVGKNTYVRICQACHGPKADGKGLIASTNFLTDTFQRQSDGDIYYKIATGRNKMPPLAAALKEDELWSVINYLRVLVDPKALPPAKDLSLIISTNDKMKLKTITAFVYEKGDSLKKPMAEVDVHFYIKRDFGLMRIAELSNYTKTDGKITVKFPNKIIGDKEGNVTIVAKIENNMLFNDTSVIAIQKWGAPLTTQDEQFAKRALWGSRDKSPIWLLLLANGIILGVWAFIIYVILNIYRIKKQSKVFIK